MSRLRRMEKLWGCDEITHNQLKEGAVESVAQREKGSTCFIEFIRETAQSAEIGLLRTGGKMAPTALSLDTPSGTKFTTSR